ncbi:MAG: hypothetical protein QNK37_10640 [Acidobacteriota bacterium]|nr:hypothetical protein [Acidobacteriota bacterium]
MRRWIIALVVLPLVLLGALCIALLTANGNTCPEEGLAGFDLVKERLPQDDLYDALTAIGRRIQDTPTLRRKRIAMTDEESGTLLSDNMEVLEELNTLLRRPGNYGPKASIETENRRRVSSPMFPKGDSPHHIPLEIRRLKLLLLHTAGLAVRQEDEDALMRYLGDLALLAEFELQNPPLVNLMTTLPSNMEFSLFMALEIPADQVRPEMVDMLPKSADYRKALIAAMYMEYLLFEHNNNVRYRQGTSRLLVNRCKASRRIAGLFKVQRDYLEGPWGPKPSLTNLTNQEVGLTDYLLGGGVTEVILSAGLPMYDNFTRKVAGAMVMCDIARLRLLLALDGGEQNGELVSRLVEEHGLIDPYTGQPYSVTGDGRLRPAMLNPKGGEVENNLKAFNRWIAFP